MVIRRFFSLYWDRPTLEIAVVLLVLGTRPEVVKCSVLVSSIPSLSVLHTGQHHDLCPPIRVTHQLEWSAPHGDPFADAHALADRIRPYLTDQTGVVVQGDTTSAYAGALAARDAGLPLFHVEAGIRSGDRRNPWPEEDFRIEIDRLATTAFCATEDNAAHLRSEGFTGSILVTGNPGIDHLYRRVHPIPWSERRAQVLITLHRRESHNDHLTNTVAAVYRTATEFPDHQFLWPRHPNPEVERWAANAGSPPANVQILPAMESDDFVQHLAQSQAVLTDSGGVQEESAALGVPCVVAREVTDRPESVVSGHAVLAGRDRWGPHLGLTWALRGHLQTTPFLGFGDGHSVERIRPFLEDPIPG